MTEAEAAAHIAAVIPRRGGKLRPSQIAMKAAREWQLEPERNAAEMGARHGVSRSTVERAKRVLDCCTLDQIAAVENGQSTVAHAVWELRGRPTAVKTKRDAKRQEMISRAFRKAIIETEAGCVSMKTMVEVPELDREARKFALAALERARLHLTQLITKIRNM